MMHKRRYTAKYKFIKRFKLYLRDIVSEAYRWYLHRRYQKDLFRTCRFSLRFDFDKTNLKFIYVGDETYIAFGNACQLNNLAEFDL